ncbi:hypothetical protein HYW67_03585 [Candidatus Parcubacteria bacterium]|nr:hypothetical protein [Candidatus Parcubacteria bacterium]
MYRLLFRDIRKTLKLLRRLTGLTPHQIRTELWPRAQLYWHRLVGATIRFVLFPLVFFIGGGLLGGVSPLAKDLLVGFGTLFAVVPFFYFLQRAALLGIVVPILFEASRAGDLIVGEALAKRLEQYGRNMAGVLASEFVIGLIVWIAPLHEQPRYLLWLIIAALAYAMWALWTGGVGFWKKVVRWVPAAVIAFIFLAMIFPGVPRVLGYARQSINDSINCTLPGANCPRPPAPREKFEVRYPPVAQASISAISGEGMIFLKGLPYFPTPNALQPGQCARVWIEGAVQPGWEHIPLDRRPVLERLYLDGLKKGRNPILDETEIVVGETPYRFDPATLEASVCNNSTKPQYVAFKTNGWGGSEDSLTVKITPQ